MTTTLSNNLTGNIALITGGARGIGATAAEYMASAGAKSVVITDILDDEGEQLVAHLRRKYATQFSYYHHDTTDEQAWSDTISKIVRDHGRLNVLVNNAGIEIAALIENYSYSDYKRQMAVNSDGVFLGCREAIRAMKPGGIVGQGGSIVNLSSIAGLIGLPGYSVYGGSKGFVRLITKHLAVECARLGYGIRVNSVHPGLIKTQMGDKVIDDFVEMGLAASPNEATEAVAQATPLGRLGNVDEIAAGILYLASDASSYVTGTELVIDGGWAAS